MLFDISEDNYNEMRELIREDAKREFRLSQIENEGNDPVATGMSFGTPHDLASIYGREQGELPAGYDENLPGRPREKMSVIGTNADPMGGRDRLGVQGMKGGFPSDNENVKEGINNTMSVFLRNKNIFTGKKQNLFEQEAEKELDLLNEENIKDLDN
jgi:hypothetical protein